jgi:hypothetical protein
MGRVGDMDIGKVIQRMIEVWAQFPPQIVDKFVWKIPLVIFNEIKISMTFTNIDNLEFMGVPVEIVSTIETEEILFAIKIATEAT